MISIYLEGSGNNKAIELHNPTSEALNLSQFSLLLYSNGRTAEEGPTTRQPLPNNTVEPGGYFVITHPQAGAALQELSDLTSTAMGFNGDDAVVLTRADQVVDSIGQVGYRPTTAWYSADRSVSTANQTLTNRTCQRDDDPTDAYDPSVNFRATVIDDVSTFGTLDCSDGTPPDPEPEPEDPTDPLAIGEVQGDGETSPYVGRTVTVTGAVTASYQGANQFTGFYLQDAGDDDPATSDAIFVYAPNQPMFNEGDVLTVSGTVSEYYGQTQITTQANSIVVETGQELVIEPTVIDLPVTDWERYEGMLLTFPQELVILEYFEFGRYGEVVLGTDRQYQPTSLIAPGPEAVSLAETQERHRIRLDDGRGNQNPSPAMHPDGQEFTAEHTFRGGDTLTGTTGVLSYRNNAYKLQPTDDWFSATYMAANPRTAAPELAGDFTVASFNVLNYFTTLGSRGANTDEEFERQQEKIVSAIAEIDADVVGLIEIENNGTAVHNLVTALNAHVGEQRYAAINTGRLGSDEIVQAFIYQPATTQPVGDWAAYDPADGRNRPALTQRFRHLASGEEVAVSINHFKSKGSACEEDRSGYDSGGAGNCNLTRLAMAEAMMDWFEAEGFADLPLVVLGDLNSYAMEDPIQAMVERGYTDLDRKYSGTSAYSYVFDGRAGYLDYAMANAAASELVVDTQTWHINADEPSILDYTMQFKQHTEQELWSPHAYRSSDHDPVIVGLQLGEDDDDPDPTPTGTPSPTQDPSGSPSPTQDPTGSPSPTGDPSVTASPTKQPTSGPRPRPKLPKTGA